MAVNTKKDEVKVVLKFTKGSQTLAHCSQSATDESLYNLGEAIGSLNAESLEEIMKVTEEQLIKTV